MYVVIVADERDHRLEVDPLDTPAEVKEKLQFLLGYPVRRQILSFEGKELTDRIELKFLDIEESSRIVLSINSKKQNYKILVKILTSEFSLEVEEMDTVSSLKETIPEHIGAPSNQDQDMVLHYRGNEIRDRLRLCQYRIGMNAEITASFKPGTPSRVLMPPPKRLSFVVETWNGESIPFAMTAGHTVSDMKKVLIMNNHLPADDYLFIHKQTVMEENKSLLSQGVQDGDSIAVFQGKLT
ncbi:hypothetical protein MRB53_028913 [Persea americana]|uniref:Uncharacterized protein n=1 Tax=Persea americana TaxID=3435 RepID=A0ACC2KHG3_PERAE|nr:hypothetical protein MRB53_028913 [Persea americana]